MSALIQAGSYAEEDAKPAQSASAGFELFDDDVYNDRRANDLTDASDYIVDIREYDVPYHVRVSIDKSKPEPPA